jgi:phosphate uptake regulator
MGNDALNEERLNLAIRKFLKVVGVTSQREIEQAIRDAVAAGQLSADGAVEARVTLELPGLEVTHVVEDRLELG